MPCITLRCMYCPVCTYIQEEEARRELGGEAELCYSDLGLSLTIGKEHPAANHSQPRYRPEQRIAMMMMMMRGC